MVLQPDEKLAVAALLVLLVVEELVGVPVLLLADEDWVELTAAPDCDEEGEDSLIEDDI